MVGQNGLEPSTSRLSVVCSSQLSYWPIIAFFTSYSNWWRLAGSNRWPPACKAGALPAELNPRGLKLYVIVNSEEVTYSFFSIPSYFKEVVGQNGLEPSTSRLSVVCSSQLSYWPIIAFFTSYSNWWRLAGSNRWPPACKAGALPAELNPHLFPLRSLP